MIIGKRIGLRALEQEDLSLLRDWRNREHYRMYFREYRELNLDNQRQWFEKQVVNNDNHVRNCLQ